MFYEKRKAKLDRNTKQKRLCSDKDRDCSDACTNQGMITERQEKILPENPTVCYQTSSLWNCEGMIA
jgi:hypothetical protein